MKREKEQESEINALVFDKITTKAFRLNERTFVQFCHCQKHHLFLLFVYWNVREFVGSDRRERSEGKRERESEKKKKKEISEISKQTNSLFLSFLLSGALSLTWKSIYFGFDYQSIFFVCFVLCKVFFLTWYLIRAAAKYAEIEPVKQRNNHQYNNNNNNFLFTIFFL